MTVAIESVWRTVEVLRVVSHGHVFRDEAVFAQGIALK